MLSVRTSLAQEPKRSQAYGCAHLEADDLLFLSLSNLPQVTLSFVAKTPSTPLYYILLADLLDMIDKEYVSKILREISRKV